MNVPSTSEKARGAHEDALFAKWLSARKLRLSQQIVTDHQSSDAGRETYTTTSSYSRLPERTADSTPTWRT